MTRFLLTVVTALVVGVAARAGGPPPVYVVVDEVKVEPATGEPERVIVRGNFIRLKEGKGYEYGSPVKGVIVLGLDKNQAEACRAEWKQLAKAVGTGKVVSVGTCGDGGVLMTVKIHKPGDTPKSPDATYTPGFLGSIDDSEKMWRNEAPVKALKTFVKEGTGEAPTVRR